MRRLKIRFENAHLALIFFVTVMIAFGSGLYYFANMYYLRAQVPHLVRSGPAF